MIIIGAGLAGCIAAHLFPGSRILEAGSKESVGAHKALLRFRSEDISKITGIPFRKVRVTKRVSWYGESFGGELPIYITNAYSRKVTGRLVERSIGSLESVDRWIAPDDFHAQLAARLPIEYDMLIEELSSMVLWREGFRAAPRDVPVQGIDRRYVSVLSTVPLPVMLKMTRLDEEYKTLKFERAPIKVLRGRVRDCDLFQTVYFPDKRLNVYRASITGDLLIVESINGLADVSDLDAVREAFGLRAADVAWIELPTVQHTQSYGKITPLATELRQAILLRLSHEFNVFSLGRFATWRNLLLDDLPRDADRIRGLMRMSEYERRLESAT